MAVANIDTVRKRVIEILNASPGIWSTTVSGEVGSFAHSEEIDAAIFEADSEVVVGGYLQSANRNLSAPFSTISANLVSGDSLPYMRGQYQAVELSKTGTDGWVKGIEAASIDDITNAILLGVSYVGKNAFTHLFKMADGKFYTPANFGRIKYANYARTAALQANETEEFLVIATAIRFLAKNASNANFEYYAAESIRGIGEIVSDGQYQQRGDAVNA